MKVSIIICVHNMVATIGRAVRSAVDQRFEQDEYEVVVVDDGSTDGTANVLKTIVAYEPKVRLIRLDENMGLSYAKNVGIKAARGIGTVYLDGDDWILKHAIFVLYEFLNYHKDISYVWPDYFLVDEKGDIIGNSSKEEGSGVMFRKSDLEEVGLFDENLKVWEEKDMYMRLKKAGKTGMHIPLALYKYTQRQGSLSRRGLTEKETGRDLQRLVNKHFSKTGEKNEETPGVDN